MPRLGIGHRHAHRHGQAGFDTAREAAHYEHRGRQFAGRLYDRIAADVAGAGLADGARVLDVGTGPGLLPVRIAAAAPGLLIDAVDVAPAMIERARLGSAHDRVSYAVADVADLPFPDDRFDLVISTLSQHHWADPAAGMHEVARVLRPGGRAWIYDFRWALGRAEGAAFAAADPKTVSRQRPVPGWPLLLRPLPIGRLELRVG